MSENDSKIPAHAPQPQDHKKKKSDAAREAEANGGFVDIEYKGLELRVPVRGKVPLKALMAFKRGDEFEGTRILFGDEQWEAFLETDPLAEDFNAIGTLIREAAGN
ncbi:MULTISPECIES: adenylosuccinate synthase [Tsukamurella]|uniref:adenylosuccinate synthase n=1 Tax=Tsukamurella TaxID=2060 RepID=UPI001E463657|nr:MULTISPECIES: adenylosuccinate synthase [Tsukamurella]